jgi:hypothetical protein
MSRLKPRPTKRCGPQNQAKDNPLGGGFGDEEAAEAVVDELDADEAFAGVAVADVHYAALGGEVVIFMFATGAGLRERDGDVEVHAHGYVEAGAEGGAAAAEIFTRGGFLERHAAGVNATNGDWQADGDAALGAGARCGKVSAGADLMNHLEALTFLLPRVFGKYASYCAQC